MNNKSPLIKIAIPMYKFDSFPFIEDVAIKGMNAKSAKKNGIIANCYITV
jgi:hypothetical protein